MDFKNPIWAFFLCVAIVATLCAARDCDARRMDQEQASWQTCVKVCGGSALVNSPSPGCFCIEKDAP